MNNQVEKNSQINEENDESEDFMLFEKDDNNSFKCGYSDDYVKEDSVNQSSHKTKITTNKLDKWDSKCLTNFNKKALGLTPKCNQSYQTIKKDEVRLDWAFGLLKTDIKKLAENNMKDYLNVLEKRRNNIPKLWIYDYQSTYVTNYTDEQRIKKTVKYINNLL